MARRRGEQMSSPSRMRALVVLACAAAAASGGAGGAHAFVVPGSSSASSTYHQQPPPLRTLASSHAAAHSSSSSSSSSRSGRLGRRAASADGAAGGGVEGLYTNEPADPNRRVLKLAFLAASRPKGGPKTEKEKSLDKRVWGRWKLVEESIDRPDPEDLKMYGAKLKPHYSRFEEDLVLDMWGTVMLTKEDTNAYGLGWAWTGLKDVYSAPTLKFRINRKSVGIDFDEYEDVNDCPTISFYSGQFTDGNMDVIEGVIQRNRDAGPPKEGQPHVLVTVGTFRMVKVADYQL